VSFAAQTAHSLINYVFGQKFCSKKKNKWEEGRKWKYKLKKEGKGKKRRKGAGEII